MAARERGDAWVSGGGVQLCECVAPGELPRERVLSTTRADDQYLHPRESRAGFGWFEGSPLSGIERV
jgi:hypothetical protein